MADEDSQNEPAGAPPIQENTAIEAVPESDQNEPVRIDVSEDSADSDKPEPVEEPVVSDPEPENPGETVAPPSEATTEHQAKKPKRSKKKLLFITGFAVLNIAILAGTAWALKFPKTASSSVATTVTTTKSTDNSMDKTTTEPPKTLHFNSDALKLEFDYPSDWRITSNPDNSYILISSAPFQIKQSDGTLTKVRAILTIFSKYVDTNVDVTSVDTIMSNSEKLVYKNPTKIQRKETFLSFKHSSLFTGTDIVTAAFISGDLQYKIGQSVGSKNFQKINPFIIFRYVDDAECDDVCFGSQFGVSRDVFQATTELETAKGTITSMRFNE